ncbi:hypothetical protein RRG44_02550 [Mycoplasmopsis cynos]|uniref:hypothetical protein n=1 Tax=Mycoplasmopsis cynos TaxID=171284 RepID=UPI002AFE1A37|nr:hypothetical protein [Mycoplasmopsis cynos]WQQ18975.1 hypothetical protein RRG44_02550 [Mycoplasmopsis cynos]
MGHIKNFFSFKNIKNILVLGLALFIAIIVFLLVGFKVGTPFKPTFYNYKSYISKVNEAKINQSFDYKTFNEIDEFTVGLINNKAIAGIGSDFQTINLIKKGYIKKVNFEKLLNRKINDSNELKQILQKIYTPIVFKHLESYDEELKTDEFGNLYNKPKHLWEYFVPYFQQDGVIAYNSLKASDKSNEFISNEKIIENYKKVINKSSITNFKDNIKPYSLFNILNTLKNNNYNNLVITDAVRVNMLYGSPYKFTNNKIVSNYGSIVNENNYKILVDSFIDLIQNSTNKKIDDKAISFNGDGLEILRSLIDPSRKDITASIMFNGDALDAYYSEDNGFNIKDKNQDTIPVPKGTIKVIKFSENVLLVDGLVVSKNISNANEDILYQTLRNSIYANIEAAYTYNDEKAFQTKLYDDYLNILFRDKFIKIFNQNKLNRDGLVKFDEFKSKLRKIFDSTLNDLIDNSELEKFKIFVQDLFSTKNNDSEVYKIIFKKILNINTDISEKKLIDKTSFVLSHIDFKNESWNEFLIEKYPNLENFAFINYTPSNIAEYDVIKRNYFINENNTFDKTAISIFEVNTSDNNIKHQRIRGVSEKTQSLLNTYYNLQIKH